MWGEVSRGRSHTVFVLIPLLISFFVSPDTATASNLAFVWFIRGNPRFCADVRAGSMYKAPSHLSESWGGYLGLPFTLPSQNSLHLG